VSAAALISLRDIRKSYGREGDPDSPATQVLRGISLDIHAGEFVAIVGASGSGKSTLMHILGCLDRPSGGRYLFEGEDVAGFDADALAWLRREAFGFVFQGYHLVPTESARENVEIPALYAGMPEAERRGRATALLRRLDMGARLDHRPNQLSGGQQQMLAIARALMCEPRMLLLDEPSMGLAPLLVKEIFGVIARLKSRGIPILLVEQNAHAALSVADRGYVLETGAIALGGPAAQLLGDERVKAAYLGL